MKQISESQLKRLALADKSKLAQEIEFSMQDWLEKNAHKVIAIELKRVPRTLYGEFPKGWKAEMKQAGKIEGEKRLIDRFRNEKCMEIEGVLWLTSWEHIQQIERKTA